MSGVSDALLRLAERLDTEAEVLRLWRDAEDTSEVDRARYDAIATGFKSAASITRARAAVDADS